MGDEFEARLAARAAHLGRQATETRRAAQAQGVAAKQAGGQMDSNPFNVGCWMWMRWLEGWAGVECPLRDFVDGSFNMTPRRELYEFGAWMRRLGVPEPDQAVAEAMFRRNYTEEALGSTQ